jgi:mRNA interferase MazF
MAFQTHDVWLVKFPFSDLSTTKTRPALVMSSDVYHLNEPDVVFAALTSNPAAATNPTDYILKDWQGAGLKVPTALQPLLATLSPSCTVLRIGRLKPHDAQEISKRLRVMLDL